MGEAAVAGEQITIRFKVTFNTQYGQIVAVRGSLPELAGDPKAGVPGAAMSYEPWGKWSIQLTVPLSRAVAGFTYRYLLVEDNGKVRPEGGSIRRLKLSPDLAGFVSYVELKDTWQHLRDYSCVFDTLVFSNVIFARSKPAKPDGAGPSTYVISKPSDQRLWVRIQIKCARLGPEDIVCLAGSHPSLGVWDIKKAFAFTCEDFPYWKCDILVAPEDMPFDYKYVICNEDRTNCIWEDGYNRSFSVEGLDAASASYARLTAKVDKLSVSPTGLQNGAPNGIDSGAQAARTKETGTSALLVLTDDHFHFPSVWKGAGMAIPVFSLRSRTGLGIGEFLDLKLLADWCAAAGMQIIQLLPINDTSVTNTWRDSYPYSSVSVTALHPMYINLEAIGNVPSATILAIKKEREKLNALPDIDYEAVITAKRKFLREIYTVHKNEFLASAEFKEWYAENRHWLVPYALFCFFRDLNDCSDFTKWGNRDHMTLEQMEAFVAPGTDHYDTIALNFFIQFHLNKQLIDTCQYAHSKRIAIKGDLPIGVNKFCADTWVYRNQFRMHTQTGAPPDFFAVLGQNWGFPTYDWNQMKLDGYEWWRSRLSFMSKYFDAYRIDHILGFFRIWEIPEACAAGIMGRFRPCVAVKKSELDAKGIWDLNRLLEPYIRRHLLERFFGSALADTVIATFLEPSGGGLRFKADFNTERKLEAVLAVPESAKPALKSLNAHILESLTLLMDNVILIRDDEDQDAFHFRIRMMDTASYIELPNAAWKKDLYDLYINYFYVRQDDLWKDKALEKLPMMMDASDMLVCGEDLGMVPDCVAGVLEDLSILGLRIQRMPTNPKAEFGVPSQYPYLTVCTPSCHDMSTVRGWWEEDQAASQRFYNQILGFPGPAPAVCTDKVATAIVDQHLNSPSMLTIFPLQDLVAMRADLWRENPTDEQINVPANPHHYWRYRFHIPMETLLENTSFSSQIKDMVTKSGRLRPY